MSETDTDVAFTATAKIVTDGESVDTAKYDVNWNSSNDNVKVTNGAISVKEALKTETIEAEITVEVSSAELTKALESAVTLTVYKDATEPAPDQNAEDVSKAEAKAKDVVKQINALTADSDEAAVNAAREAYDALTDAEKALIKDETLKADLATALKKLEAAEKAIEDQKKADADAAAAKKAAEDATKLINDLPAADKLTTNDKAKVEAAKAAYDVLNADAKALVEKATVDKLNAAVAKIEELEKAGTDKKVDPTQAPKVGEKKVVAGVTYKVAKKNTVTYQKPKTNTTKVTVPATVKINGKSYKVTSVANNAFKGNKKVKTVTVGKNVTSIGAGAFQNCKALTKVTLPAKTTTIGKNAFANSKKLKTIVIKSTKMTKKTVKNGAFNKVSKKTTVDVPNKKAKTYKKLFQKKGLPKACKVK